MKVDCGVSQKICKQVAKELNVFLANSYVLYTKTQNFHWNLVDARFYSLHLLFEKQYHELQEAIDMIAEKIRSLGEMSPGSMKEMLKFATLKESATRLSANQMLQTLLKDNESLCKQLCKLIDLTGNLNDLGTQDMLIERLRVHEKQAWFLRSHFSK